MNLYALILFALFPSDPLLEQVHPPTSVLRDAIRWLAPYRVSSARARRYARIIHQESMRKKVSGFLVVAFIHVETAKAWNPWLHSPTNDFGLTQVHVAARGSETFLGREEELYDARTNIREWVRLAAMWRAYHQRECGQDEQNDHEQSGQDDHPWWAHMKYGYRVKPDISHALKVARLYLALLERFWLDALTS